MQAKAASVALGKEGCGAGELLLASYKLLHEVLGNIEDFWPSFKPSRCHLPAFPFPTPLLGASSASASLVAPSDRSDPDATALLRLFFLSFFGSTPPPKKRFVGVLILETLPRRRLEKLLCRKPAEGGRGQG